MLNILIIILGLVALKALVWFVLKAKYDEAPPADEVHSVRCSDGWRIKLYRRFDKDNPGEPIILCHGIMGDPTNFMYPTGNGMVDTLVEQGYDCWVMDLRGNRHCAPPIGTSRYTATYDDHYMRDFPAAIDHILTHTGFERLHWIGHSMGGMLLYTYAAVHGTHQLASGTTIGTPPGFKDLNQKPMPITLTALTLVPALADPWLRTLATLGPVVKLSASFAPINWKNMAPNINFFSTTEYAPPSVLRQIHDWASTGTWKIKEANIDMMEELPKLDIPLHVIAGSIDPLSPKATLEKFHDNLPGEDKRFTVLGKETGLPNEYNHVDLVFSQNSKEEVHLPIVEWLNEHPANRPKKKRVPRKKTSAKKKSAAKAKVKRKNT